MYISSPCVPRRPTLRRYPQFSPRKALLTTPTSARLWPYTLAGLEPDLFKYTRTTIKPSIPTIPAIKPQHRIRAHTAAQVIMRSSSRLGERSYSWPPSLHHFTTTTAYQSAPSDKCTGKVIDDGDDDGSFSHFISPVLEEDDPVGEMSWSAGIVDQDSSRMSKTSKFCEGVAKKWSKYVAQRHEALYDLEEDESYFSDESNSSDKLQFRDDNESFCERSGCFDNVDNGFGFDDRLQIPSFAGSYTYPRPSRNRRTAHRRNRSWQKPSVELFTVPEENESLSVGLEDELARVKIDRSAISYS